MVQPRSATTPQQRPRVSRTYARTLTYAHTHMRARARTRCKKKDKAMRTSAAAWVPRHGHASILMPGTTGHLQRWTATPTNTQGCCQQSRPSARRRTATRSSAKCRPLCWPAPRLLCRLASGRKKSGIFVCRNCRLMKICW